MRSSQRREARDLQELQSRHEGTQGAHLPQEAKMAVPEVQEGPNAGAQAAIAVKDRNGERLSKESPRPPCRIYGSLSETERLSSNNGHQQNAH